MGDIGITFYRTSDVYNKLLVFRDIDIMNFIVPSSNYKCRSRDLTRNASTNALIPLMIPLLS